MISVFDVYLLVESKLCDILLFTSIVQHVRSAGDISNESQQPAVDFTQTKLHLQANHSCESIHISLAVLLNVGCMP